MDSLLGDLLASLKLKYAQLLRLDQISTVRCMSKANVQRWLMFGGVGGAEEATLILGICY